MIISIWKEKRWLKITEFPSKKGKYFFGSVKMGKRGQIVIPAKAREIFDINFKDDLHIVGNIKKGLGISKIEVDSQHFSKEGEFYFETARVSERGQIVIPQEAREKFELNPGDLLLVFGDINKGLGIIKSTKLKNFAVKLFQAFGFGDFNDNQIEQEGNEKDE